MNYDANSIQVKSFRDACRDTPGCYLGADGTDGIFNCFLEILNNACDEAIMKRGNKIEVIISKDCNTCTIQDYGVGIPHGPNKNTKEVLIDLFTTAHSSGKFDNDNYKKVRGLHGLGSSAVCVCSTLFEVNSKRDGYNWDLSFKNGNPQTDVAIKGEPTTVTGTRISFTPDKTIFHMQDDEQAFSYDRIRNELRLTSYFIPNVTFSIECGESKEVFLSKNGLKDFAKDNIEKPLHKNYIYAYKEFPDEVEIEVFGQWTGGKEERYIFSNGALNEDGGTPETGAKTAFTRTINSLSKGNFDADMIRKGLVYIVNIRHPKPIYQNQTKNKIQNPELRGYTQTVFGEAIKDFVNRHGSEFDRIVDVLTKEKKAEMAADRARKQVLEATKEIEKSMKEKIDNPDKLRDARKLGLDSTLLICEGLSAGGSMSIGRDPLNIGILMLRGKAINSISNPIEKVLNNEEIQLLLKALGINYNKPYNSSKLRYGKIAIAVDSDLDR